MENTFSQNSPADFNETAIQQKKSSNVLVSILGAVVLSLLTGVTGFYLGTQRPGTQDMESKKTQTPVTQTVSPVPSVSPVPVKNDNFSKRLFDPSKEWFSKTKFPEEVTKISDEKLLGLKCTPKYSVGGEGGGIYFSYSDGGAKAEQLNDQTLLEQVKAVEKQTNKRADAFMSCEAEDGSNIFIFEQMSGGGGSGNTIYFGSIKDASYQQYAQLLNPGIAYFGCGGPLELTTEGQLYIACGGGDGGGGGGGIYNLNLSSKKVREVAFCTSELGKVSCK